MNERHGRILAKLSELSLTLAVDLHTRALAAEDTDEVAELANAFQKIARGLRQTMALEAKLARDAAAQARDKAVEDDRTRPLRTGQRIVTVRKAVERLIWTEVENDEDAEIGVGILADIIDEFALNEDFLDTPLEVQIERLKTEVFGHLNETFEDEEEGVEPPLQNTG
jgi:hypothetical protein